MFNGNYSKRQRVEGFYAEGKRLTGQGFSIWLCPNLYGDSYKFIEVKLSFPFSIPTPSKLD